MASVSIRNERLFQVSFYDPKRTPKRKVLYFERKSYYKTYGYTKKDLTAHAWKLEQQHKAGEIDLWKPLKKSAVTFQELFDHYLASVKDRLAPSTLRVKKESFTTFIKEFGNAYPDAIPEEQLNAHINRGKLGYRKKKREFLLGLYTYGHKVYGISIPELIIESTRSQELSYINKDFKSFLVEEMVLRLAEYIAQKNIQLAYFYLLLFYIPRRRGDFIHFKPEWVKPPLLYLYDEEYVPKSQKKEIITPTAEGMQLLQVYLRNFDAFRFTPDYTTKHFKKACRALFDQAEQLSLHKLRDSGIMYLMHVQELPVPQIMGITGHSSFSSIQDYMHTSAKAVILEQKKQYYSTSVVQIKKRFFEDDNISILTPRT